MIANQINRLYQKWRNLFGVRQSLAWDGQAFCVLENDRPEWAVPGGEVLMAGSIANQGVAAQVATSHIRNPSGSGVLVIVEQMQISTGGASQAGIWYDLNDADLATFIGTKSHRDSRDVKPGSGQQGSAALLSTTNAAASAATGVNIWKGAFPGNTMYTLDSPIILPPGSGLFFDELLVNTPFLVNLWWRERILERGLFS